ncbi:MAG: AAA family ATPase [Chloroflexota bacterium]
MKLPYGNSDFYQIITEEYLYLDRTDRIPQIEALGKSLLFLRPRRFGKSMLVSMLENYYDLSKADEFEALFGHLAIGQNPTPCHNQYLIFSLDFSSVPVYGSVEEIANALHRYLNERIRNFEMDYSYLLAEKIHIDPADAFTSLLSMLAVVRQTKHKVYLFIDEYDNFANEVMMAGRDGLPESEGFLVSEERYNRLVISEGIFKSFFKNIKSFMRGMGLERVFITGVSPIVLSDVTSGHNIAKDLTWRRHFNDLCGFTEEEVRPLVAQTIAECQLPLSKADEALELMRTFYNGSRFTFDEAPLIYNPTLVFYFLDAFAVSCRYPDKMLDGNFAPDYAKLVYISTHLNGEQLLLDALHDEELLSVTEVGDRFGMAEMLAGEKRQDRMASLLCYLGALTFGGRDTIGKFILEIPNLVSRRLYVERLLEMMLPPQVQEAGQEAAVALYSRSEMQPLCDFIEKTYFKVFDNRDYLHANELTIKTAFLTLLYNDALYIMDSESALERTYADLTMIIRPEMRRFQLLDILIEFKYVSLDKAGLTGVETSQASLQELHELAPVQEKFSQAHKQVLEYRQKLESKYGQQLRLRTYVVVDIGFDRVVWQEVQNG